MRALVLEGGASRGAYLMGVYRALYEAGEQFDIIVGTSVGALNGALIGQGDWKVAYDLWSQLRFQDLFSANESYMEYIMLKKPNFNALPLYAQAAVFTAYNGGLDIAPLKALLRQCIDEEKLRQSGILFGLTTINLSKRRAEQPFLHEMEEGQLIPYLLASAYMPIFRHERLMGDYYMDGCFYDNLPWKMLNGYDVDSITAIRLPSTAPVHLPIQHPNVRMIVPSERLPSILSFHHSRTEPQLLLGYLDGKKSLGSVKGNWYYVETNSIPAGADLIRLEKIAKKLNVQRLRVYQWDEFLFRIYQDAEFQLSEEYRLERDNVKRYLGLL